MLASPTSLWFHAARSAWCPLTIGRLRPTRQAGRVACVHARVRAYVRIRVPAYSLDRPSVRGIPRHTGLSAARHPPRARRVHRGTSARRGPSNASPSKRAAARRIFLFTRPMVGDARVRRRDMSAGRTAVAGGSSCHRGVGVRTLRPGDKAPRGRRAPVVSNFLPISSAPRAPTRRAARSSRACSGAPRVGHREAAMHARYFIFTFPVLFFSARPARGEDQPPGTFRSRDGPTPILRLPSR